MHSTPKMRELVRTVGQTNFRGRPRAREVRSWCERARCLCERTNGTIGGPPARRFIAFDIIPRRRPVCKRALRMNERRIMEDYRSSIVALFASYGRDRAGRRGHGSRMHIRLRLVATCLHDFTIVNGEQIVTLGKGKSV